MARVLTLWCTTRQCEVTTDIWTDAEGLVDLAQRTDRIRCAVCGREHASRHAYLTPVPPRAKPIAATVAQHLQQRRADAH